jgi:hypothetical protein
MEIKTITCHDVYNYGATLQAYALMKFLQNKNHDVEIINYKPVYLCTRYNFWYIASQSRYGKLCEISKFFHLLYALKNYTKRYKTIERKEPFDKFKKYFLNVTKTIYKSNEELKRNPPFADLFITGSDQVWNSVMPNGKDPAFYLDFVPEGSICASYAASFGQNNIQKEFVHFVKELLNKFKFISVRETTGLRILESIDIKNGTQVLDPVFLLTKQEWSTMLKKQYNEKYLLVYDFIHDPAIEEVAKKIAKEKKWKIYSINDYKKLQYANKNISNAGPIEFMELIKSSQMVISNSFHGTAFSIIFEKEFYVFSLKTLNNNSRMIDFLSLIGLSDRHISSKDQIKSKEHLDYFKIKDVLDKEIMGSKYFLNNLLSYREK